MKTTLAPVRRETSSLWDVATEMDRLFDSPFELLPRMTRGEGLWHPTVDIYDRPREFVVELELPGVRMEDLDLKVEENHLVLEGTRKKTNEYKEEDRFYSERLYGKFHRVIHLPGNVDAEKAEARCTEGLLVIRLPKIERATGRKIDIKKE